MPGQKNRFDRPKSIRFFEERILDRDGDLIGVVKVKPSAVLWKPKRSRKFYSVPLEQFTNWIIDPATKATLKDR